MRRATQTPPKNAILPAVRLAQDGGQLAEIAQKALYVGNASHKRNALDYKLNPPTAPRSKKSLCDDRGLIRLATAQALLQRGIEAGLVNGDWTSGWPRRVWSVDDDGNVWEAKLDSAGGTYHGYPLEAEYPFAQRVLERVKAAQ